MITLSVEASGQESQFLNAFRLHSANNQLMMPMIVTLSGHHARLQSGLERVRHD